MLALFSLSFAYSLEQIGTWSVPADTHTILLADSQLLLVGTTLQEMDPLTGTADGGRTINAVDGLWRDANGDGVGELWTCGESGIAYLGPTDTGFSDPVSAATETCSALIQHSINGQSGLASYADNALLWYDDGLLGLTGPTATGLSVASAPLLSATTTEIALASEADRFIYRWSESGTDSLDAAGRIGGLGIYEGSLAWTLPGGRSLQTEATTVTVYPRAGRWWSGDVTGDGVTDIVLLHLGEFGLIPGGTTDETLYSTSANVSRLAVGDVDGDDCADIVALDPIEATVSVYLIRDCGETWDADGDGYGATLGDCDDTNASIYPDAVESCDGLDNDCDDRVDEPSGLLRVPGAIKQYEGESFTLTADGLDGCTDTTTIIWDVPADAPLSCTPTGWTLACNATDNTETIITATPQAQDGETLDAVQTTVLIHNVRPRLNESPSGCDDSTDFSDSEVTVRVGNYFEDQLDVIEPGADTVVFALEGGPPGLQISTTGYLVFDVTESDLGRWPVALTLADEDGGITTEHLTVIVNDALFSCNETGCAGNGCAESSGGCSGLWCLVTLPILAFFSVLILLRRQP